MRDRIETLHIVALQKSDASNSGYVRATANLGVYSKSLAAKLGEPPQTASEAACHWRARIGHLTPEKYDKWWSIADTMQAATAGQEMVVAILEFGIPELNRVGTDFGLIEEWRAGRGGGLPKALSKRYLSLLSNSPSPRPLD